MNPETFEERVSALLADDITEPDCEALYEAVRQSRPMQSEFARHLIMDACLRMELAGLQPSARLAEQIMERIRAQRSGPAAGARGRLFPRFLAAAAAFLVAAGAAFVLHYRSGAAGNPVVTVWETKGTVTVEDASGNPVAAAASQGIRVGQRVSVAAGGYAKLAAGNLTVELGEDTRFAFLAGGAQRLALLDRGRAYCALAKAPDEAGGFAIQAPFGARAEVVGTRFEFVVDGEAGRPGATVRVEEGTVRFWSDTGGATSVGIAQESLAIAGSLPTVPRRISQLSIAPWRPGAAAVGAGPLGEIVFQDAFEEGVSQWEACEVRLVRGAGNAIEMAFVPVQTRPERFLSAARGERDGHESAVAALDPAKAEKRTSPAACPESMAMRLKATALPKAFIAEWDYCLDTKPAASPAWLGAVIEEAETVQEEHVQAAAPQPGAWYHHRTEVLVAEHAAGQARAEQKDFRDGKMIYSAVWPVPDRARLVLMASGGRFLVDNVVIRRLSESGERPGR